MKALFSLAILAIAVLLGVFSADFFSRDTPDVAVIGGQTKASEGRVLKADQNAEGLESSPEGLEKSSPLVENAAEKPLKLSSSKPSQEGAESSLDSARRLRDEIRDADSLPAERQFINNSRRLSLSSAQQAFGTENFAASLDNLREQAYENPAAQDLSDVYRDYLFDQFEKSGARFSLEAFACGVRVCMGEALAMAEGANWHTNGLYSFQEGGPPMYATIYDSFQTESGQGIYQFLFSIDPESTGIALPRP